MKILVALIMISVMIELSDGRYVDPRCQPMRIPWCSGVYDAVIFPNFLGHQTQEDAYYAMHKMWPLIQTQCSPQILHYLCRLYAPQCPFIADDPNDPDSSRVTYRPEQYRPPCEDACLRVRHDCYDVLYKHQIHWPEELECHHLRKGACFETPQQGQEAYRPQMTQAPPAPPAPSAPAPEPEPEPTTTVVVVQDVETTTTDEPESAEQTTDHPKETTTEASSESSEEASTITHSPDDGLVEMTTFPPEETTTMAPEDPITTEEPTTEAPPPVPEPEPEATTTEDTDSDEATAAPDAIPIGPDSTTGSLFGITPVIQEDPATPDSTAGGEDADGSGEEATTEQAADAANVAGVDATAEETTISQSDAEETTIDHHDEQEQQPTAEEVPHDEQTSNDVTTDVPDPTANPEDEMATTDGDSDASEPPRSDRAIDTSNGCQRPVIDILVIYLVAILLWFHQGA